MAELADQASSDTLNDNDRAAVQKEFSQLRDNISDIAVTTDFNGQTPLHPIGKPKDEEPYTFSGKADIVFLVDTTSSMGYYIRNVAQNVETFTNSLADMNIDYKIAIETFNEQDLATLSVDNVLINGGPYDGQYKTIYFGAEPALELDFSDDSNAISDKLNDIASGVGDAIFRGAGGSFEPESGLEGVEAALQVLQNGRDGAVKQIIVISDATFHDSTDT